MKALTITLMVFGIILLGTATTIAVGYALVMASLFGII
jgi:hypothetical protein